MSLAKTGYFEQVSLKFCIVLLFILCSWLPLSFSSDSCEAHVGMDAGILAFVEWVVRGETSVCCRHHDSFSRQS